ncbi:hypothetical protein [Paradevosia shaoguanensis]|uniref:hypothetical protein n=1 Tax=Paradevosia shaoguanensis TaxID=1335043 RepID=UPI00193333B3|nr:hypothetical protein [Paradevosia shaoguanensis]
MEGIAQAANLPTLSTHIISAFPDVDMRKVKRLRNQYWNAIKHFYSQDGKTPRDDEELLADFSDVANDAVLFEGWLDYLQVVGRLPVSAQVFQLWWYAMNEERMTPETDPTPFRKAFPDIRRRQRTEQKRMLRRAIERYRGNEEILRDPRTEPHYLSGD